MSMAQIKSLLAGAVTSVALFAFVSPAGAATYAGSWDPAFGPTPFGTYADLQWSGAGEFKITDSCVPAAGSGSVTVAASASCAEAVDFANVSFSSIANPSTVYGTINFGIPIPSVFSMDFVNGKLVGLLSNYVGFGSFAYASGFNSGNVSAEYAQLFANYFYIGFVGDQVALYYTGNQQSAQCLGGPFASDTCGASVNKATLVIGAVPEPSTYALLIAGLGVIGFCARRRRR